MWFVYFLKSCKAAWYYVGSTNDLERRVHQHNAGMVPSTKNHIPLNLVYSQKFEQEKEARAFEKRVKQQRLLKEQIIRNL